MDNMIIMSSANIFHTPHLQQVFKMVWQYNMRFNPEKFTFTIKTNKLLGFYLTKRGIGANPNDVKQLFR